ncbi:Tn7-like element transposition protein TnsE [Acinetobacter lwoffii]|jgi:hypothetical protein|uniref:TnsE C-terminal domain-containing protein n=1 Tax=Acinetobacter lwoffii NCTC 5866 = CIP 64.10 = NIPH 512 TaxID=981327 RepID=A0ABP2ZB26_ACILW|nr:MULTISPECIES: Tn7-like element transposition protein TnsE [Acinetobacter]ENU15159.1 hypothetical protein F995_03072 [Acinetobacter sp. CIP A162]ESJ94586.1 hypothetical protein P800_02679 [Acinetobacter lwoffii NCTC 5866 = CIP 64.10 = NIPH 512]MCO8093408.1 Tn7-like element transposition protein TnsE [Acinetobacter lwoffii]MDH5820397.1 Tn7-like element transposition protein TnsE [Acinetobacter pseudolwoffii]NGP42913.1 hypothetical protein [Acinetobacter lwoffii]
MTKIKNFPENARITFLGSIFKERKNPECYINIGLENYKYSIENQRYILKYARFSNMPLLARNRRFNQTETFTPFNESTITIQIDNFQKWNILINESGQYNFSNIVSDINEKYKDIEIILPQIELARVLFLHNAYLSRSALDQTRLSGEFDIIKGENQTVVNIPTFCNFPPSQYDNVGMRRLLAWILLDTEARTSFESISKKFLSEKFQTKVREYWNFNFVPPSLKGAEITLKVYFSPKKNKYYVNEILAISNLPSEINHTVIFCSPKFTVKNTQESSQGSSRGSKHLQDEDPIIDDKKEANSDKKIAIIDSPKITLALSSPFETKKAVIKRSGKKGSFNNDDITTLPEPDVGTGESTIFGEIGRGEFENCQDESDDLKLFMKRFESFQAMIEEFRSQNNILSKFRFTISKLPAVNRSKLHKTDDGNFRSIAEVQLEFQGKKFSILEIDTSDNYKPLSTLIVKVEDFEAWDQNFPIFKQQIIRRSLRWPTAKSLKDIGIPKGINHPKNKFEISESDKEFADWLKRFTEALKSA